MRAAAKKEAVRKNEIATPGNLGEKAVPYSKRGIVIEDRVNQYMQSLRQNSDFIETPPGEIKLQDLAILSTETGVEYSLLTISEKNYLVRGSEKKTTIPETLVQMLIDNIGTLDCHSHPYIGDLIPSDSDKDFLKQLMWQRESVIIDPIQNTAIIQFNGPKCMYPILPNFAFRK